MPREKAFDVHGQVFAQMRRRDEPSRGGEARGGETAQHRARGLAGGDDDEVVAQAAGAKVSMIGQCARDQLFGADRVDGCANYSQQVIAEM
jgi:hypothetical protein